MNLEQLKELKDGDEITFKNPHPFTVGKGYLVKETEVGRMIYDDNGLGHYLMGIEQHFEKKENKT